MLLGKLLSFIGESVVSSVLQPWQLLIAVICGWVNRHQQYIIDLQNDQIQTLLKALGKKPIPLTDDDRRRLAVKAKRVGRKALFELTTIVTPDTILRWHRQLVAQKWNYSTRRKKPVGRPPITNEVKCLVVRMATENPNWGYDRISGEMANLGHTLCDQSVGNILKEHGIEPAPARRRTTSWKEFIHAHWDVLAAVDFTTIEVRTYRGLVTYYLLFVMDLSSRRVEFAGMTPNPTEAWMDQIARNLTDCEDGFLKRHRYLLMDRDTKFCQSFRDMLESAGVKPKRLPARSPNLNAHIERFMRSLKDECLNRLIFFGERSVRNAVDEFLKHYHHERNHQGLDNGIIDPGDEVGQVAGNITCRQRLGGLLKYYHRKAA